MKFYQKLFANFYDVFMHNFEKKLYKRRSTLLSNLEGNVLSVGEGTGVNYQFYNENTAVYSVEPSKPMLEKAKIKAAGKKILFSIIMALTTQSWINGLKKKAWMQLYAR